MKYKYLTCIGYHGTGAGAVDDFLKEFSNVASAESEIECRFLQDPDGISDLEYNLVENAHRLNSGFALKRYINFAKEMNHTYKKIFGKKWMEFSKDYIDSLTKIRYKGYWHGDLRLIPKIQLYIYYARRVLNKYMPKSFKKKDCYNYFRSINSLHSFISEEEFLEKTKVYMENLARLLNKSNKEYVLFDQLVPTMNIERYTRYIDNLKVILVDRDPRDTFLNIMLNKDHVLPTNIDQFCEVYKDTRRNIEKELETPNVLFIQFEDLIYKYEETTKKVMDFVGLKEKDHIEIRKIFKPEISINNTQQWKKHSEYNEQIKYIENNLKKYLYKFDGEVK